jgi:CBS domain-containing protein
MQAIVRDAMSKDVASVNCHVSIADAERLLVRYGLEELFVSDNHGALCGVVPDYALLKQRLGDVANASLPVATIMSRRFLVITPDCPLTVAGRYLREHVHRRLAVVENMRLIGQVTRWSVLALLSSLDSRGHDAPGNGCGPNASHAVAGHRFDVTQPEVSAFIARQHIVPADQSGLRPPCSVIEGS